MAKELSFIFGSMCSRLFFFFFNIFYCISSDFSDLPDMTDEYIDLSVCSNWLVVIHIAFNIYTKVKCMKMNKYI